jgi:hypothetical protein
MKVRRKAFPWEASDCDYLDLDCHAEFQKAKAERKAAKLASSGALSHH